MKIITHTDDGELMLQGTDAWKQMRVGLLTGTQIESIMPGDRGPKASRAQALDRIVSEILTGKPGVSKKATAAMQDGVEREPFARMAYEALTGRIVDEVAFLQHDWLKVGVSPDGMVHGERRLCEIKSPEAKTHANYLTLNKAPDQYKVQIQSQLWVSGYAVNDFVSYHPDFPPGLQLHVVEVPRDEPFIKQIDAAVSAFLSEVNVRVAELTARNTAWLAAQPEVDDLIFESESA